MIPVYIVHYDKLTDRYRSIMSGPFANFANIITESSSIIRGCYKSNPEIWNERCKGLYDKIPPFRELKHGDIECSDKHMSALLEGQHLPGPFLVLEDDAIPNNHPIDIFRGIEEILFNKTWDVAIIGGAFDHTVAPTLWKEGNFIRKGNPSTNTVCGYIIKPSAASLLLAQLFSCGYSLPIDFEYNYWFKVLNFKVVHYVPYLFTEGSSIGAFKGSQIR